MEQTPLSDFIPVAHKRDRVLAAAQTIVANRAILDTDDPPEVGPMPIATLENVAVSNLFVDHEHYQRPLSERRIAKMIRDYDPLLVGTITVNRRADGVLAVIDGQYRVAMLRQIDDEATVPAIVYDGLSLHDEIGMFWKTQATRVQLTSGEKFVARLAYGEPQALDIVAIAERVGMRLITYVDGGLPIRACRAYTALDGAYRSLGPEGLERLLMTLMRAWGATESDCFRSEHILALSIFYGQFPEAETDRVVERLAAYPPIDIRRAGAAAGGGRAGSSLATGTARAIMDLYNKHRRGGRLVWRGE